MSSPWQQCWAVLQQHGLYGMYFTKEIRRDKYERKFDYHVGFFVLGALCGVYHLIPYDFTQSKLSFYALCALMFSVGVSVGNDPQTLRNFRSLNPRLIFLPVMTILQNTGRMRSGQSVSLAPLSNRLYGSKCGFSAITLYPVSLLQNIRRSGVGNHCIIIQYHT